MGIAIRKQPKLKRAKGENTEDLQEHTWAFVLFGGGYKAHLCPRELVGDLIADIELRGGETGETRGTSQGLIDLSGMIMKNRPLEEIDLGGFKLIIPSQDFAHFLAKLEQVTIRKFAGGKEYFKIRGWMVCVVFTPAQRLDALRIMETLLPDATRRCEEADTEFERRLGEINKDKVRVVSPKMSKISVPKDNN